jgi:hypothetical protein
MNLKGSYLAVIAIAVATLLAGCAGGGGPLGMKDCGTDKACFDAAALNCTPARAIANISDGTIMFSAEVRGGTLSACNYYVKLTSATPPAGVSEEEKAMIMPYVGKDLTCTVPAVEGGAFGVTYSQVEGSCTGELKGMWLYFMAPMSVKPSTV